MKDLARLYRYSKKQWRKTIFGKTKKSPSPIKWGILGLGYMAETFSTAIDGNKHGIVYSAASRSEAKAVKFAKRHTGCKPYGSYREMIKKEAQNIDVIYIATPVQYHYEQVKECLEAGINVLCEKPITRTLKEFEDLKRIAHNKNCFLMEGMWMKCLPTFQEATKWINNGEIGKIELLKVDFYKRENLNNKKRVEGVLLDYGIYSLAFIEHFLYGYPDRINSYSRNNALGLDCDWHIRAKKNDIMAIVNISSNFGSLSKASIIGNNGYIEWEDQFNRCKCISLFDSKGNLRKTYKVSYDYEGFEYEINEVQNCIRKGLKESDIVSLSGTEITMQILEYLEKERNVG